MHALGRWSVHNRVAVNLIMVFMIVTGLLTLAGMRREMFPQFTLDMVHVSVEYPGATPAEVEEGVCVKIEEQIKGIEGIRRTYSSAHENLASVTVELEAGVDPRKVMDEIKTEVDRIETFPADAKDPVVVEIVNRNPAVSVAVFGEVDEKLLRRTAEKIRDELVDTGPISMAVLVGVRDYEIGVEVSEDNLRRYGLSFDQVAAAIAGNSLDMPGGTIKTVQGEILVRSKGQRYTGEQLAELPLITMADGTLIRLGQIADVIDGFQDTDIVTRFNGKPAAMVQVNRTSSEDIIAISDTVHRYVETARDRMPAGVQIATWFDLSGMVRERIDLLLRNGGQGMALVFICLALFLNLWLAFWVAMGIPIAFMGGFIVLDAMGQTINMISLFAFIMALGIVVDDAIIVGENIFTHYGMGKPPVQAVADGLAEVAWPVVMAVATTVVAFVPLLFIPGIMGKFISVMPTAVIILLTVSLAEALVILPAHMDHALHLTAWAARRPLSRHARLTAAVEKRLNAFVARRYAPAMEKVARNRYLALALGIALMIVSIGMIAGGHVPFVFMPKGESDWVIAEVTYPLGTPVGVTESTIALLQQKAFELEGRFAGRLKNGIPLLTNTYAMAGLIPRRDWKPAVIGGHCGEVWIEMVSSAKRPDLSVNEVIAVWRGLVGDIAGIERLTFYTLEGGPAGSPIEIQLIGEDFNALRQAADSLKAELKTYPGTHDIADDFNPGKPEIRLGLKESARSLGLTMADLARQVRQAFYGEEARRIQRGKDDVKVMVRYAGADRQRRAAVEEMRIRTADGRQVPIMTVAERVDDRAYAVIRRVDRKRVITVRSDVDETVGNASRIVADLGHGFLPGLIERTPGLKIDLEGHAKRTRESLDSLKRNFLLALMGIFFLLAAQFRSYVQPAIIIASVPFGMVGSVVGHLVMGLQFTMISIFGVVALAGIAVNDALVLVDFINRARDKGVALEKAVIDAGKARFRPVLLTSITTIAGLLPLLLERSFQAQFLIPMAVSICFGLLFTTVLTLFYVPTLYLILDDIRAAVGRKAVTSDK